ncbi:hypothetical protein RTH46_18265 [Pseudomonas sp. zfem004]|uniref:hypothetical protein n=1 Tax=Pseudomonas sp. zfem004 TaxID=3078199 RepID=UPI0029293433|nr:hypothetical protein [Pseudomonas sp. zfem004]MDU9404438.1 hypothetical protein [Pseudomonas sp. zfem004]
MKRSILKCVVLVGLVSVVGCVEEKPNTFKLVGELPPDFGYEAVALYEPEPGTKCEVTDWRRTMPSFNRNWPKEYSPTSVIEIRKTIKGCRMIVSHIKIRVMAFYGSAFHHRSEDRANVGVYTELDEKYRRVMNAEDGDTFYGKCQWLFRTMGPDRVIRKILDCKKDNERGEVSLGSPFGAYLVSQLPGKTVRMNIRLEDKEIPSIGDTWIEFPYGWKRCLGKGVNDLYGFCRGNQTDFVDFKMPDGRICSIYPNCGE